MSTAVEVFKRKDEQKTCTHIIYKIFDLLDAVIRSSPICIVWYAHTNDKKLYDPKEEQVWTILIRNSPVKFGGMSPHGTQRVMVVAYQWVCCSVRL